MSGDRAVAVLRETGAVLAEVPHGLDLLEHDERARADALSRPAQREDFLAAHVLARLVVARLLGEALEEIRLVQRCARCGGPHGRPSVVDADGRGTEGVSVSWSHAGGAVAAVAATAACGIDVEVRGAAPDAGLLAHVLTAPERARVEGSARPTDEFLRLWMRKEALVKAVGLALDDAFACDVTPDADGLLAPRGAGSSGTRWRTEERWSASHACGLLVPEGTSVTWG